jgi:hypothetical protein
VAAAVAVIRIIAALVLLDKIRQVTMVVLVLWVPPTLAVQVVLVLSTLNIGHRR